MAKKLAVMVLHGMGDQGENEPSDSSRPTYSRKLHKAVRREFGTSKFDNDIAWREVFYSHITQENQDDYYDKVKRRLRNDLMRKFVIKYLGDVAAYRYSPNDNNASVYDNVHAQVTKIVNELRQDAGADVPIVILAHSLGGHVISNYIYDRQRANQGALGEPPLNTVAALVTFGCNIPLFTFGWAADDITAIDYPGSGLAPQLQLPNWWRNYYDKDDILGYPLAFTGDGYKTLGDTGALKDFHIDAGWFGASMTPYSHALYWGDIDLIRPVATLLRKIAGAI